MHSPHWKVLLPVVPGVTFDTQDVPYTDLAQLSKQNILNEGQVECTHAFACNLPLHQHQITILWLPSEFFDLKVSKANRR